MRLVLFQPEIAQNAGAATRAAACFDAGLDIIEPCGFPIGAKSYARVAMDYGHITPPSVHASWTAFENSAVRQAGRLVLLTTKADMDLWDWPFAETDLIMLGQESAGVPDHVHAACDARVRIPISANTRSLNMAMAGAIALAAARRTLMVPPPGAA